MNTVSQRSLRAARPGHRPGRVALSAVAVTLTSAMLAAGLAPGAVAGPPPGTENGQGEVWITSATALAKGQVLTFAGEGFAEGSSSGGKVFGKLSGKFDAMGSGGGVYTGTATNGTPNSVVGTYQVQGDGTVSGSIVVPADLDSSAVNPNAAGPHFLRLLNGAPAVSKVTDDFTLDASAQAAPPVQVSAATASRRGTTTVTLEVSGTGFRPGEVVTVARTQQLDVPLGTVTADASGNVVAATAAGKVTLAAGKLLAGEHQLVLQRAASGDVDAVAQVQVKPLFSLANATLGGTGTVSVVNGAAASVYSSVELDPNPDVAGDEFAVTSAPLTTDATGAGTAAVTIPDAVTNLGTKNFTATRTAPFAETITFSAKVSPSSALKGVEGYDRVETPKGAIQQGLYQSAYSARSKAVFATSASVTATSTIYKLDPDTLQVLKVTVPAEQEPGKLWAAYGVGVDDENGTVWVTNTRQNTVAVYSQDDLSLLAQLPAGVLSHTRDVVADPAHDVVYVSSASEGTSGDGAIGVFEADDKNGNGVKYEMIDKIAEAPRTQFSPMSLELDEESGKLITVSNTSQKAYVYDTSTGVEHFVDLPDIANVTSRGASGAAYDPVTRRLFVATQASDEVLVAQFNGDFSAATTVTEVATGAGALNVHFDPVKRLAYVSNFGGTTISVLDPDGTLVANLPLNKPNHVSMGVDGAVYAVNKDTDNVVVKLTPKGATGPVTPPTTTPPTTTPPTTPATVAPGKPRLKGNAKVGKKLRAQVKALPAGTTVTYRWTVDGKVVKGKKGKRAQLRLTRAMAGKKVQVTVTVTGAGQPPVTVRSAKKRVKR